MLLVDLPVIERHSLLPHEDPEDLLDGSGIRCSRGLTPQGRGQVVDTGRPGATRSVREVDRYKLLQPSLVQDVDLGAVQL